MITILKPRKLVSLFLPTNLIRGKINIDIKKIIIIKTILNSRNCIFSGFANFGNHLFDEKKINESKEIKIYIFLKKIFFTFLKDNCSLKLSIGFKTI